jgi:hypothetical protein
MVPGILLRSRIDEKPAHGLARKSTVEERQSMQIVAKYFGNREFIQRFLRYSGAASRTLGFDFRRGMTCHVGKPPNYLRLFAFIGGLIS